MREMDMKLAEYIILAVGYLVLGGVVLLADWTFASCPMADVAKFTMFACVLYWGLSVGTLMVYGKVRKHRPQQIVPFYLVAKMLRFFLTLLMIVAYGLAGGSDMLVISINVFVIYVATAAFMTFYCISKEKNSNE